VYAAESIDTASIDTAGIAPSRSGGIPQIEAHGIKLKQSGFIGLEGGQIVHGLEDGAHGTDHGYIDHSFMERLLFQYVNDVDVAERIRAVIAIECQLGFSYPYDQTALWESRQPAFSFYPDRAEAMYTLGDRNKPWLQFGFGYFPFRANPDVRNLGEYMFRTNTYPVYVINNFNRPYNRLLGFRIGSTLFDSTLHMDALLTSSNILPPLVDYSLSFLASYRLLNFLDVGAGVSFAHLFPVNGNMTAPPVVPDNQYIKSITKRDTVIDTVLGYYTFAGTKPTARFALDLKTLLFSWGKVFNQSDLRIYGEWCVTAWENQVNVDTSSAASFNHFYENRGDRTLYMMGINLPIFRLLQLATFDFVKERSDDVFSIEVEHFPNVYANNITNMTTKAGDMLPLPTTYSNYPAMNPTDRAFPWYWSVYLKKMFLGRFAIVAQCARDHMKPVTLNIQYPYPGDVLVRQGDWWWNVRLNLYY
jgi:hypothetical protein